MDSEAYKNLLFGMARVLVDQANSGEQISVVIGFIGLENFDSLASIESAKIYESEALVRYELTSEPHLEIFAIRTADQAELMRAAMDFMHSIRSENG